MVKIQVLGKGYHPRIGFLPKWTPFMADQNTIGWLLATSKLKIRYFNPETNQMEDITKKNYIPVCNKIFSKPIPQIIPKEIYEKEDPVPPPSVEPNPPNPPPSPEQPQPPNPDPGGSPGKTPNEESDLEAADEPLFIHNRQDKDFTYCNNCGTYAMLNPDIEDGKLVLYKDTMFETDARVIHHDGKLEFSLYAPTSNFKYETYEDPKLKRTRIRPKNRVERVTSDVQINKDTGYVGENIDYVENCTAGICEKMPDWDPTSVNQFEIKYFNYKNCPFGVAIAGLMQFEKNLDELESEEDRRRALEGYIRYGSVRFFGFPNPELGSKFDDSDKEHLKIAYVGNQPGKEQFRLTKIPFIIKDKTFLSWYDIGIREAQKKDVAEEKRKTIEYSKDFTQVNIVYEDNIRFAVGQNVRHNPRFFEVPEGKPFSIRNTTGLKRSTFFVRKPYQPSIVIVDKELMPRIHEYNDRDMRDLYITTHYLDETHTRLEQRSLMNRYVYDIDNHAVSQFLSDRGESIKSANIMGHHWNDITSGCTSDIWFVALRNETLEKDPVLKKALWANYKSWFDANKAPH
nr:MAG TPA: hypothetical protein [Caudoviricetes sp.]